MNEELQPLRLTSRPQIQTDFKGRKIRAVRNKVYIRPPNETFHVFLVNHLLWTFGKSWFDEEHKKQPEDRHVVLQWWAELVEQGRIAGEQQMQVPGPARFRPSGNVRALMVLADDLYQVEHALRTPKDVIKRLRDRRQFQGSRNEILAASVIARCGFKIDFINDKTKKSPEFFALKEKTKERIAVEAKSRHRKGVIHEPAGESAMAEETPKAAVGRLLREALEQNPGGMPFFIFIDLNLPLTPRVPTHKKPWFNELKETFDQLKGGTPDQPDEFTGVIFTNFGWHYYREKGVPGGEYLIVTSRNPRFPVEPETWALLKRALDEYGFIPDEEQHEKKVRARYPEFGMT